jgi:sulfate transport system permease protein
MAGPAPVVRALSGKGAPSPRLTEPPWVRRLLIGAAVAFVAVFLVVPIAAVFVFALERGPGVYAGLFSDPAALAAVKLTLLTAAVAVPVNVVFGVAAAWAITRFRFPGRGALLTLIDLPFTISPVISGLVFVLMFGSHSLLGAWLSTHDIRVVFATPGVVLATVFVTFPFVARELIPLMEALGSDEETAALTLGAAPWQMFVRVTLPNIRWGLLYGIILCNARAMGEFGAVSVVSGHIRGRTNTLPLHIEILYNEYQTNAAFAAASLLTLLAVVTLVAKETVAWRLARQTRDAQGATTGDDGGA